MTPRVDEQKAAAAEEVREENRAERSVKGIGVGLLVLIAISVAGWATFVLQ